MWSKNIDNDYFTPKTIWEKILSLVSKDKVIYEPYYGDGRSGEIIRSLGYEVIHNNENCYEHYQNYDFDIIITNPPFSKKKEVFEWLFKIDKPFMVLVPITTLTTSYIRDKLGELKFYIFRRRVNFYKEVVDGEENLLKKTSFDTILLCYKCDWMDSTMSLLN